MSDYGRRRYRFSIHGQPWYLSQQRARQRRARQFAGVFKFSPGDTVTLAPIIDAENLLANYNQLEREGGQAPGPDGNSFSDLGRRERADACRAVSDLLAQGRYRPGPARQIDIPKPSGGTRTLTLRDIIDRMVSRAVASAITPVIDARLLDCVMGFRPGRSIHQMLSRLEATVLQDDLPVIATDDIRQAFDFVPIDATLAAFARHISDRDVLRLVETILRGHDPAARHVGIDQGDPLSPLALNILLDHVLDRPLVAAGRDIPSRYWRYADNLLCATRDVSTGRRILDTACRYLDLAGLATKREYGPIDLRRPGSHVDVLGFRISRRSEHQLTYELTRDSWHSLHQQLSRAHETSEPARMADMVLRGWLEEYGPTCGDVGVRDIVNHARCIAIRVGFREIETEDGLLAVGRRAYERWMDIRRTAFSSDLGNQRDPVSLGNDDNNALRTSLSPRSPQGEAEAAPAGDHPAAASSPPDAVIAGHGRPTIADFVSVPLPRWE